MKLEITDNQGLYILKDRRERAPSVAGYPSLIKELEERSVRGDIFFVNYGEEISTITFEVVDEGGEIETDLALYKQIGGNFLLNVPSGEVILTSLDLWRNEEKEKTLIKVSPGFYSANIFTHQEFDSERYGEAMIELIGPEAWKLYNKTDQVYSLGCLSTVVLMALLIFGVVEVSLYYVLLFMAIWVPYLFFIRTARYQAIEHTIKTFQQSLPLFVIKLSEIKDPQGLTGGSVSL